MKKNKTITIKKEKETKGKILTKTEALKKGKKAVSEIVREYQSILSREKIANFYIKIHMESGDKEEGEILTIVLLNGDGAVNAQKEILGNHRVKWKEGSVQPEPTNNDYGDKSGWFKLDRKSGEQIAGDGARLIIDISSGISNHDEVESDFKFSLDLYVTLEGDPTNNLHHAYTTDPRKKPKLNNDNRRVDLNV